MLVCFIYAAAEVLILVICVLKHKAMRGQEEEALVEGRRGDDGNVGGGNNQGYLGHGNNNNPFAGNVNANGKFVGNNNNLAPNPYNNFHQDNDALVIRP